ncbi:MAG: hypothetical protein ABJC07_09885 [Acidobacteriota bacterium]
MRGRPAAPLSRSLLAVLRPVREAARGERIAVVGGAVRDRLLELRAAPRDVDVVVQGDAVALARRAAKAGSLDVHVHERFETANLAAPGGWSIDLARARKEIYRRPGALPEVAPATLEEDLSRRDFSINAIAVELDGGGGAGRRHDPFGGAGDLERRLLRVLHARSFEDDPTRILRAVRYAARLDLRFEKWTRGWLGAAVAGGALETISGDRLRRELERTLSETRFPEAVRLFDVLGVADALHPGWRATPAVLAALSRAERLSRARPRETTWLLPLLVWAGELPESTCGDLARRLAVASPARRALERWASTRDGIAPSTPLSADERFAVAALLPATREGRRRKGRLLAPVALSIRGADLLRAGISPGPRVGRALAETRAALGNGRIAPAEELAFALDAARRGGN